MEGNIRDRVKFQYRTLPTGIKRAIFDYGIFSTRRSLSFYQRKFNSKKIDLIPASCMGLFGVFENGETIGGSVFEDSLVLVERE